MPALRDYLPFMRRGRADAALAARTQSGLVSSAAPLNIGDRSEAKRVRVLRQGWQDDAWAYHDTIGEIRFARRYLANSARRMRLFPAVYPRGTYDDAPEPVAEVDFLPADVVAASQDALTALGSGRLAISQVMYDTSSQLSMAGEGYVHGHTDPQTGADTWHIRSISEITVRNDQYVLREVPVDAMGIFGWHPLDPALDYVARFWTPHPKFQMLADSSMRSILDSCEELLILSRTVRATGRSRLAGAGILKVPDSLSVSTATNDNLDPQSDPFIEALADAMLTPIGDEGTASAVVPMVVRGNAEALKALEHLSFDRPIDQVMMQQRDELIGRIATGIDLPKEVLTGLIDLNHWSAWQVSDDTFRHHIEPHVQECVDCLTVGYYRAALEADPRMQGANAGWIARLSLWYDPTDLVTHPDRSQDALQLHNRLVISDAALREATGFTDEDAPDELETQVRMIRNTRTFPPNVLEALFHRLDPTLLIPPTSGGGALPGEGPKGAVPSPPKPDAGGGALPQPTGNEGTPAITGPPPRPVPSLTAAVEPPKPKVDTDLSTRLVQIDRELRTRLQVAASHALLTVLSRAGAKVRSKVQKDETLRVAINQVPNHHVTATLGQPVVASLGLTSLVDTDWSDVRAVFDQWGTAAQQASLHAAVKALRLPADDPRVVQVQTRQSEARERAWHVMAEGLTALAHRLMYDPNPNGDPEDSLERANPDTIVPTGLVRQVLNVLGGGDGTGKKPMTASAIFDAPDITMTLGAEDPMPQVGTGEDVSGLLEDSGASVEGYTWVHGFALKPFDPHLELDGVEFSSFDDDQLANPDSFPAVEYFLPGDHKGCTCDFMPGWALPLDENYLAGNDAPGSFGDEGDGWTPEGATSGEDLSAMDAWQGQVANLAEPDGGFTVDPVTGESIVHGLSVGGQCQSSITPATDFFADPEQGKAVIRDFIKSNADLFSQDDIKLGGWHDPDSGNVFLDGVHIFPQAERDAAIAEAQANNEIAIADLDAIARGDWDHAFINTGGTGGLSEGPGAQAVTDMTTQVATTLSDESATTFAEVGARLDEFGAGYERLDRSAFQVVTEYTDGLNYQVNPVLRGEMTVKDLTEDTEGHFTQADLDHYTRTLDKAMQPSPEAVVATRVMPDPIVFGLGDPSDEDLADLVGTVVSDPAYLSTSLPPGGVDLTPSAASTARGGQVVMTISVPEGTPSIPVFSYTTGSGFEDEHELLLARNTNLAITSARYDPITNAYLVNATVIPGGAS